MEDLVNALGAYGIPEAVIAAFGVIVGWLLRTFIPSKPKDDAET